MEEVENRQKMVFVIMVILKLGNYYLELEMMQNTTLCGR